MMPCPRRDEAPYAITPPESDHWDAEGTCSYCGSMNPEKFMQQAEAGAELGPTDKSYKVYINGNEKFYFQHLNKEQMWKFIDLLNKQKLKIGFPGHFYSRPFFISYKKE